MDALEIKEIAGLRAELDARATAQYVDGSDRALQLQLDEMESDLVDLENEQLQQENRLIAVEQVLPGKAASTYVDARDAALQQQIDQRALLAHTHTSGQIADFVEAVQDTVALMLRGVNVSYTYDDEAGTVTITASPATPFDPEQTRDIIGAALRPFGLISIGINDAGDTITIGTTATQNATDAELRRRDLHTGTQAIETVEGLSTALASKASTGAVGAHTIRLNALERPLQANELVAGKEGFIGLNPRAALLKLINEGSGPVAPPPPAESVTILDVFAS